MKRAVAFITAAIMLSSAAVPAYAETNAETSIDCTIGALSAPKITKAVKTTNSVTLKWTKVKGAAGYKVYKKVGNRYKVCGTVRGGSKVRFKVKKLKSGAKYSFKVRAYKKSGKKLSWSKYSAAKAVYTLGIAESDHFSVCYDCGIWKTPTSSEITDMIIYPKNSKRYLSDAPVTFDYMVGKNTHEKTPEEMVKDLVDLYRGRDGAKTEYCGSDKVGDFTVYSMYMEYPSKDRRYLTLIAPNDDLLWVEYYSKSNKSKLLQKDVFDIIKTLQIR